MQIGVALFSVCVSLMLIESGMRMVNDKLPFSIADSRHDLGVFRLDPRWEFSSRYKKRMRPNSNTFTQWNYGDLVTTAAIPAEASRPTVNRFPISTDSEGFRNPVRPLRSGNDESDNDREDGEETDCIRIMANEAGSGEAGAETFERGEQSRSVRRP